MLGVRLQGLDAMALENVHILNTKEIAGGKRNAIGWQFLALLPCKVMWLDFLPPIPCHAGGWVVGVHVWL